MFEGGLNNMGVGHSGLYLISGVGGVGVGSNSGVSAWEAINDDSVEIQ